MKHSKSAIVFGVVTAFAAGCKPSVERSERGRHEAATVPFDNGGNTAPNETARSMKEYATAKKAENSEAIQIQLGEIDDAMDQLTAKIEKSSAAVKAEAKPRLEAMCAEANGRVDGVDDILAPFDRFCAALTHLSRSVTVALIQSNLAVSKA